MHKETNKVIKKNLKFFFESSKIGFEKSIIDDSLLKIAKQIYKEKEKFLSESNIYIIIVDSIKDFILEKSLSFDKQIESDVCFNDLFNKEELISLADKIIDYFNSFPRCFTCVFNLPNIKNSYPVSIEVDKNVSIEFKKISRLTDNQVNALKTINFHAYELFVIVKHSGYLSIFDYNLPYNIFKQIIGIAINFEYFTFNQFRKSASRGILIKDYSGIDSYFFDDQVGNPSKESIHLNGNITEKLFSLDFNNNYNLDEGLSHIRDIYRLISINENDKNIQSINRLRLALEWNYDSIFTNNEVFSFISNCFAMESLLSKGTENIESNLKEQCAEILGASDEEKIDIKKNVGDLYNLRSRLVHGEKSRLDKNNDLKISSFAQNTVKKIITKKLFSLKQLI